MNLKHIVLLPFVITIDHSITFKKETYVNKRSYCWLTGAQFWNLCQIKASWLHLLLVAPTQNDQTDTLWPFCQRWSHLRKVSRAYISVTLHCTLSALTLLILHSGRQRCEPFCCFVNLGRKSHQTVSTTNTVLKKCEPKPSFDSFHCYSGWDVAAVASCLIYTA